MSDPSARVIAHHRGAYVVATPTEEHWAEPSPRLYEHEHPVVGDLVRIRTELDRVFIEEVLPRRTVISRNAAGKSATQQILATNVDVVFLAMATNLDRFASRTERYLIAAWNSGAEPVIVLTKSDICADPDAIVEELSVVAAGVPILLTSSLEHHGIDALRSTLAPDRVGVLLGPSGVGKSSLVNALVAGADREVRAIRPGDFRGRHTTTGRAWIELPGGGAIIDTPGLRELQLWDDHGVDRAFADVTELTGACRFNDCAHRTEPGCAIVTALEAGRLDADRWRRYLRLRREADAQALRRDARARSDARREWARRTAAGAERRRLKGVSSR